MVETDIRDNTQDRSDNVGAVQPSAHAYFDNGKINFFSSEIIESHGRSQFEEGRVKWFESGTMALYKIYYIFFGYHFTVDTDAFAEIDQVGRCEKSDFISRLMKDRCQ